MVRLAEVSFWHWMQYEAHTPENEGIGLWQLARVYALTGEAEVALLYAGSYLQLSREAQLGAFHEGYAHEAMARAHACTGDGPSFEQSLQSAKVLLASIEDAESRKLLEADLAQLAVQR